MNLVTSSNRQCLRCNRVIVRSYITEPFELLTAMHWNLLEHQGSLCEWKADIETKGKHKPMKTHEHVLFISIEAISQIIII